MQLDGVVGTLERLYGVAEDIDCTVLQVGVHQDDVAAREAPLGRGTDDVEVDGSGQHQEGGALGVQLGAHLLEEHPVDPGAVQAPVSYTHLTLPTNREV